MEYAECLQYLQQNCRRGVPGGYQRTQRMAELVGNPQERLAIIHIAGTNGKGSTAAVLEAILRQAGYRVGLFTSPHLVRYEERIQIDRKPINAQTFAAVMSRLIDTVVPVLLQENLGHPGEFELLTVASWLYFAEQTDFVISEVGLGGKLDPTNIIQKPLLCVITPISLDHCQILGDTVEQIAKEKAGILKNGIPAVIAPQSKEAAAVIVAVAKEKQIPLILLEQEQLLPLSTNLQGAYQQINCNTAVAAVKNLQQRQLLSVTKEQIAAGLQQVYWPGRMEYIPLEEETGILLDGAHNPAGIYQLAQSLQTQYRERNIILFLSILDDKDQLAMLTEILPFAQTVILTKPEHDQRAQHWQQLARYVQQLAPNCRCVLYDSAAEGLQHTIKDLQRNDLLCITGSLYLLGDCRRLLQEVLKID